MNTEFDRKIRVKLVRLGYTTSFTLRGQERVLVGLHIEGDAQQRPDPVRYVADSGEPPVLPWCDEHLELSEEGARALVEALQTTLSGLSS